MPSFPAKPSVKKMLPGAGGLPFYSWYFILTELAFQELPGNPSPEIRHLDTTRLLQIIKAHAASKSSVFSNQRLRFLYRFPDGAPPLVLAETD